MVGRMKAAYLIDDAAKQTAYLLGGDYAGLLRLMRTHHRRFGVYETMRARALRLFKSKKLQSELEHTVWRKVSVAVNESITSMALFSTDMQKTIWHGVVQTERNLYMIKLLPNHDDAYHEYGQTKIVEQYFTGPFVVPHIVNCQEGVLVSRFLSRARPVQMEDAIADRLMYYTTQAIDHCTSFKVPKDFMPLNFHGLFIKLEDSHLIHMTKKWLAGQPDQMPIIPIHGDMTPWNIYVDGQERLVLSSFERAGWHVPFYDVFHYHLQPQALISSKPKSLNVLLKELPWDKYPWLKIALVLYLVDQLCCDLSDLYEKSYTDPWLKTLIINKHFWLKEVLYSEAQDAIAA